jgi:predicted CoA-substrate-specific enzyme activase
MKVVAGIDVGSGRTKCALVDEGGRVLGRAGTRTLPDFDRVASQALEESLRGARLGRSDVSYIATTGLGRHSVGFRQIQITDITCTARAVRRQFPDARFILDIGAQSTRAIRLGEEGRVQEFRSNEKCAAGSGGFLERACRYLEIPLQELGAISARASAAQPISSICAVLAESEIINHVSEGRKVEDILYGIHVSLADRALLLLKRVGFEGDLVFTGGVALQEGMVRACREVFKGAVNRPEHPDYLAATGAALLGWSRLEKLAGSPA